MIEARKNHGLVFVKDKIFAVGGQNGAGTSINSLADRTGFCWSHFLLQRIHSTLFSCKTWRSTIKRVLLLSHHCCLLSPPYLTVSYFSSSFTSDSTVKFRYAPML